MGVFNRTPLRCPQCGVVNKPSRVLDGLRYKGQMVCAKEYICNHCGCEYNNGPGYPSAFKFGKTDRERADMSLRAMGIPQEYIDRMHEELSHEVNNTGCIMWLLLIPIPLFSFLCILF